MRIGLFEKVIFERIEGTKEQSHGDICRKTIPGPENSNYKTLRCDIVRCDGRGRGEEQCESFHHQQGMRFLNLYNLNLTVNYVCSPW